MLQTTFEKRPILLIVFAFLLTTAKASPGRAQTMIPVEKALQVIESLEQRVRLAEWKVEMVKVVTKDPKNPDSLTPSSPARIDGWVLYEPSTGRYRVELDCIMPWIDGPAPYGARHDCFAFDGRIFRQWDRHKPGTILPTPQDDPGRGSISTDSSEDPVRKRGIDTGAGFFPPYFKAEKLSVTLKNNISKNRSVVVTEGGQGRWLIETVDIDPPINSALFLEYDLSKGGVIRSATWTDPQNKTRAWRRIQVELQEAEKDFWVPKTVSTVYLLDQPPNGTRITYKEVKVNHSVDEKLFTPSFPHGVRVTDHITKQEYRVGDGMMDDQAAIEAFLPEQGFHDQPTTSRNWTAILWIVLSAIVLSALTGVVILRMRAKRRA